VLYPIGYMDYFVMGLCSNSMHGCNVANDDIDRGGGTIDCGYQEL